MPSPVEMLESRVEELLLNVVEMLERQEDVEPLENVSNCFF